MPETTNTNERLASLDIRVGGLERGFVDLRDGLTSEIRALGAEFKSSSKPQWSVYIAGFSVMLGVLGFIGTAWKSPIETQLSSINADVHRMDADYVPRWVHTMKWEADQRERDRLQKEVDALRNAPRS